MFGTVVADVCRILVARTGPLVAKRPVFFTRLTVKCRTFRERNTIYDFIETLPIYGVARREKVRLRRPEFETRLHHDYPIFLPWLFGVL